MLSTLRPSIFYSQNYFKDSRLVASLLSRSSIGFGDVVYEIGPGKGIITTQLARRCRQVVAIEKDPRLAAFLKKKFARDPNVSIRAGDFLNDRLPDGQYKVFANIPFNITSAVVTALTAAKNAPEDTYLTMQKEAARMYTGEPSESLRSVLLKPWFDVEVFQHFRRSDFTPEPGVDAVMLRLYKRIPPLVNPRDQRCFRDFMTCCFTAWRPNLDDILKGIFSWKQLKHIQRDLGIDLQVPPTAIRFGDWLNLFDFLLREGNEAAMRAISGSEKRLKQQQKRLHKIHRTRISYRTRE
ncbi:MAG: 23S ribosomal RNA methyltransferase Erm [Omnitrophica WOR_2 bacterium]